MMSINDNALATIALDDLHDVTGGGKIKTLWKLATKAGSKVVDGAKAAWKATPTPVKTGLLTGGLPAAGGGAVAWLKHKFD